MLNNKVSRRSLFAGLFAGLLAAVCPRRAAASLPPAPAEDLNVIPYNAAGLPTGLHLNGSTGVVLGTIEVVTDGTVSSYQSFTWSVPPGTIAGPG
jgi:hypothetical protein